MKWLNGWALLGIFGLSAACTDLSCMDHHNPRPYWEKIESERKIAHAPKPKLTDDGKIPDPGQAGVNIDERYVSLCGACHGAEGDGKGPAGMALNPHPRSFVDKAWQAKVDDAHIMKVIKEGGASVGLSASMAPWGGVLSDEELKLMVQKVRDFGK